MSQTSHYSTLLIALLAMLLLLLFPLIYPKKSFSFMMLFQVFALGMALILFLIELYQAMMG